MSEQQLFDIALRSIELFAAKHPCPSQVNAVQAAEMLSVHAQTVRKMIKDGRLPINKCGLIPIVEIDRAIAIKSAA